MEKFTDKKFGILVNKDGKGFRPLTEKVVAETTETESGWSSTTTTTYKVVPVGADDTSSIAEKYKKALVDYLPSQLMVYRTVTSVEITATITE